METDPATTKIRLLLVEDDGLFRDLLCKVLSLRPEIELVGAFADAERALQQGPGLAPEIAMLDIELGDGMNGIQLGLQLRKHLPDLGIVLLSSHGDPAFLASLPREVIAGWSYLLKQSLEDVDTLVRAIQGAYSGLVVLDPHLVQDLQLRGSSNLAHLTPRQQEILALLAQGLTNRAIAQQLVLTEKSVENQINTIYQHLEIDRGDTTIQPRVHAVLSYLDASTFRRPVPPARARPRLSRLP